MNKIAIGLRFVPYVESKHLKSHFLGMPLLPATLAEELNKDNIIFLGQIFLPDIAALDIENRLPHEGYLYFFFDTSNTTRALKPIVRYSKEEPKVLVEGFNESVDLDLYRGIDIPRGVEFYEVDEDDDGCKLLGYPCDWNYMEKPKNPLLLSISHFDEELDFLPELDGYTYIFFGPKGHEFDGAYGFYEYS